MLICKKLGKLSLRQDLSSVPQVGYKNSALEIRPAVKNPRIGQPISEPVFFSCNFRCTSPQEFRPQKRSAIKDPRIDQQISELVFFLPNSSVLLPRNFGLKIALPLSTPGLINIFQSRFFSPQFQPYFSPEISVSKSPSG